MKIPPAWPLLVSALLGAAALAGASKKAPAVAVRFHAETSVLDSNTFAMPVMLGGDPPRRVFVERIPSISERDIVAFYPFPASQGGSFGAEFQLGRHGQLTLQNLSMMHRGGFILAMVNGRPVTPLTVDRPINDGLIVVPFGLSERDVQGLEETLPHIGQAPGTKPGTKTRVPRGE